MTSNGKGLRSRLWFDDPHNPGMTALYIERYLNYGLTREELQGGKPIIGIAQTGSDLSPCNRIHVQLAERVRDGIREAGRHPDRVSRAPHPGDGQAADSGAGPQPRLSRPGRDPARLSARRRRTDHGLRQDHAGLPHGRRDDGPAGDRAVRRADARRPLEGQARRFRRGGVGCAPHAGGGRDRLSRVHGHGRFLGAERRAIATRWAPPAR